MPCGCGAAAEERCRAAGGGDASGEHDLCGVVGEPFEQLRELGVLAQELDSRASTGAIYWEGLSELLDESGRRVGLGYLEMTGYAARLRL